MDKLNATLNFEDGKKFQEHSCKEEHEDYTDRAFEELCGPEAGTSLLKVVEEKGAFHWQSIPNSLHWAPGSP